MIDTLHRISSDPICSHSLQSTRSPHRLKNWSDWISHLFVAFTNGIVSIQTLSSIVAPVLSAFAAIGTDTSEPISPRPSPPYTAPNAPSPSFLFKMSFSLDVSQSSKANIAPEKLACNRPSSRRRFLVSRYFEEYLKERKKTRSSVTKLLRKFLEITVV